LFTRIFEEHRFSLDEPYPRSGIRAHGTGNSRQWFLRCCVGAMLCCGLALCWGQEPVGGGKPESLFERATKSVLQDQRLVWQAPLRTHRNDLKWLLPAGTLVGLLLATDDRNVQERLHANGAIRNRADRTSNWSLAGITAIPFYLSWQAWRSNDTYQAETGKVGLRAATTSLLVSQIIRLASAREAPASGGAGGFWHGSALRSSFPSVHAAVAWSMVPVLTERHPGWLSKVGAYGIASTVSFSRLLGERNHPSDVMLGSVLGYAIGHLIARNARVSPQGGHFNESSAPWSIETPGGVEGHGSVYLAMDSWVYPALDRLAAMGFVPTQIVGLRPWTRAECLRQVQEAEEMIKDRADAGEHGEFLAEAGQIVQALKHELSPEGGSMAGFVLESVYARHTVVTGEPLRDSFHFGQTLTNDFGRPFGEGWNSQHGISTRFESGRWFGYVRAEHQYAPGRDALPLETRELIALLDGNPIEAPNRIHSVNRARTIEAYGGVRFRNLELSLGKQALYWGPTYDGPLSFSVNAEPTKNAKVSTVHPFVLPGMLSRLGGIRTEFVIGKLGGHRYTWRPWFNAQKVSFKLTENLEMGFTRWSILWGVGHPITARSFLRNFSSFSSPDNSLGAVNPDRNDPGDRKSGFDFRYRLPGLRNWVTLYSDSYADDDPSPLAAPRRAAFSPGLYLARFPGTSRLDLRAETASTVPFAGEYGPQFIYYNNQYHSGNTNYGFLLGNAVGRHGRTIQGWIRYWISPRSHLELGYRQRKVAGAMLPGGGTQTDFLARSVVQAGRNLWLDIFAQAERHWIPALSRPRRNVSIQWQIRFEPRLRIRI
jgi:membrane-associated phospholipid phosphatase